MTSWRDQVICATWMSSQSIPPYSIGAVRVCLQSPGEKCPLRHANCLLAEATGNPQIQNLEGRGKNGKGKPRLEIQRSGNDRVHHHYRAGRDSRDRNHQPVWRQHPQALRLFGIGARRRDERDQHGREATEPGEKGIVELRAQQLLTGGRSTVWASKV